MTKIDFDASAEKYSEVNKVLSIAHNSKISALPEFDISVISAYQSQFGYGVSDREYIKMEISDLHKSKNNLRTLAPLSESSLEFLQKTSLREKITLSNRWGRGTYEHKSVNSPNRSYEIISHIMGIYESDIKKILDSNFVVTTLNYSTSFESTKNNSLLWHFDPTPLGYYKVFCYLKNQGERLGATEFLDSNTSHMLMEKNYHNISPTLRKGSLTELEEILEDGRISQPISANNPGQVVVFNPATTCHRAIYPSKGRRDVLVIGLLKSKIDWRDAFKDIYQGSRLTGLPVDARWPVMM